MALGLIWDSPKKGGQNGIGIHLRLTQKVGQNGIGLNLGLTTIKGLEDTLMV